MKRFACPNKLNGIEAIHVLFPNGEQAPQTTSR
jgi:hypothetical protein